MPINDKEGDSLVTPNFGIQIDGITISWLSEVSALTAEQDVIEFQEVSPDGKAITRKMPGPKKAGEVTVTRGMTSDDSFTKWAKDAQDGKMDSARKNATILFMDYEGKPVKRYNLKNAWCSKVETAGAKAGDTSPMTEAATIVYEEMEIEGA